MDNNNGLHTKQISVTNHRFEKHFFESKDKTESQKHLFCKLNHIQSLRGAKQANI